MTDLTAEQVAVRRLRNGDELSTAEVDFLLSHLPKEMTEIIQLPEEVSSAWEDNTGRIWITNSVGEWSYNGHPFAKHEVVEYLPFRRLVPERKPITAQDILDIDERTTSWTEMIEQIVLLANGKNND